ncbi:MAG: peptide chain release factor-like protein [Verrucomicrobiales bacterium]|nr:peptide chain release factor-like protein [Verrucomicrobiales bacterium]MEC5127438.1 peptide chain release factor-like protein [Verrucomicrobiales bacterium BCK34]
MKTLEQRMKHHQIFDEDLEERFVLGSGSGGQKINKTSSCVYLKHIPTGTEIKCQESRSREKNRELARVRLCDHFDAEEKKKSLERAKNRAVKRYKKRKPSKAEKARRRRTKQLRTEKKANRRKV